MFIPDSRVTAERGFRFRPERIPTAPLCPARPVMTKYSAPPYLLVALTYIGHNAMALWGEKFNKFALPYVFSGQIN